MSRRLKPPVIKLNVLSGQKIVSTKSLKRHRKIHFSVFCNFLFNILLHAYEDKFLSKPITMDRKNNPYFYFFLDKVKIHAIMKLY